MSKKVRKRDEDDDDEDGVFDDDDDDDSENNKNSESKPALTKKRKKQSFIDDAAEESGDDAGEENDDEDDEDDDNNDYIKDGFVVDEEEDVIVKKKDDLEDSDDESDDDADDGHLKKISKMRATDRLDDDDLALINEAQGLTGGVDVDDDDMPEVSVVAEKPRKRVVATTEDELRKGLFYDSEEELNNEVAPRDKPRQEAAPRKPARVERYDEDGMDDFIEDDIGDQEDIRMSDRKTYDENSSDVNEAQLNEASEIFGTDYLEFMQDDAEEDEEEELLGKGKYREVGVGVQYGMDSEDEEVISDDDDDDDLFADDDDDDDGMDGSSAQQKAEGLRLKREKRKLAKAERRRLVQMKKSLRRKAQLRKAFEPVQLIENFCTDRDDDIRQVDIPERLYDWKVPFYGSESDGMNDDEELEASWIARRIPDIASEFLDDDSEEKERIIHMSIANALRYMHRDKLETAFIKRYRKDYVLSLAVQNNLDRIMEEDMEWDRMLSARTKVEALLVSINRLAHEDENIGANTKNLLDLQSELADAQKKLDETAKQEAQVTVELSAFGADNDDDDELFGDDDDDDDEVRK